MANNKNLKPFKKGDPRINRKGRPKSFDKLRELALQIAHEEAKNKGECVVIEGKKVTIAEMVLRQWASSKNPTLQKSFMEIAFGKVPEKHDITSGGKRIGETNPIIHDRALSTLADALREKVSGENGDSNGSMASSE